MTASAPRRAAAEAVDPAALGHVADRRRTLAAKLDEAARVVAVRRGELALLGEAGAGAALARRAAEEQVILCCCIGYGRILKIGDDDVFGHEVNLASKLGEDVAEANEILVTRAVMNAVADDFEWEEQQREYAGEGICWKLTG